MITLISALLGFVGAAMPDIFKLIRDHQDRKHELKILQLQLQQQAQGYSNRLEEIAINADIAESRAIYKTWQSNIKWVDALNGSVRPILAYAFFILYATTKILQFALIDTAIPATIYILWQPEDQAIFAGIISFYYGQRAMRKLHPNNS